MFYRRLSLLYLFLIEVLLDLSPFSSKTSTEILDFDHNQLANI